MNEWSSPTVIRMAAEATWNRETYDQMVADWHHKPIVAPSGRVPSRARSKHDGLGLFSQRVTRVIR